MNNTKESQTIGKCLQQMRLRDPNNIAIKYKKKQQWVEKNWQTYYSEIETIACGLNALGMTEGDRVAIMANTQPKWATLDLAILGSKLVSVPIYQNNKAADVKYILNNSEARVIFCEERDTLKIVLEIIDECPKVEKIIVLENNKKSEHLGWRDLKDLGSKNEAFKAEFEKRCLELKTSDMATLLYTSGTTGLPKGVVMTHLQIISEASEAFTSLSPMTTDTSLSFLPYAHILGRIEIWGHVYIGYTMAFAQSLEAIRANLIEVRPNFVISVPRIFEKVHSAILGQVAGDPVKSKLFNWAVNVGKKAGQYTLNNRPVPLALEVQRKLADKLVLAKIREAFGGRLRFAISGGAPLATDICLFFHAAGILLLEGYGLTETTAAIAVNTPSAFKFGTVGKPVGEAQIRIASDGEIMIKSDKVMKEYYNNPEANKEAFTDGWYHTGDIGEIDSEGFIKITDRKKDLIKTAGGKYIAPQKIEGLLALDPLVGHVLVFGDQQKYAVALITLDKALAMKIAKDSGVSFSNYEDLIKKPVISEKIGKAVKSMNEGLASYERIKTFHILPTEFTVEGGELTPSLKVKRKLLTERYKDLLLSLYH